MTFKVCRRDKNDNFIKSIDFAGNIKKYFFLEMKWAITIT